LEDDLTATPIKSRAQTSVSKPPPAWWPEFQEQCAPGKLKPRKWKREPANAPGFD